MQVDWIAPAISGVVTLATAYLVYRNTRQKTGSETAVASGELELKQEEVQFNQLWKLVEYWENRTKELEKENQELRSNLQELRKIFVREIKNIVGKPPPAADREES